MFSVYFESSLVATVKTIEESVSLALALHRSSNVEHVVCVNNVDNSVLLRFSSFDNKVK